MKKEDLFKAMSDLDQNLIAETKEEGIEVSPIRITEGKRRFNYKPVIAAACCAVLIGTAVAVGSGLSQNVVRVPSWYTDETVNDPIDIGEPSVWASSYPKNAKYQYKGDYSEIKFETAFKICDGDYYSYRDLINSSDLAVVGEFVDDPRQDIDPNSRNVDSTRDVYSYNRFKIDTVLTAEGPTSAESGTEIVISQRYAIVNGEYLCFSDLTPMFKGDRWVYFLDYDEERKVYYPLNDYMGRYPDPCYYQVLNRDPDIQDSANRFIPAMTNKYGLIDGGHFNTKIYRTLADILYHEYMPPVQCLYDSESSGLYNITYFELAECLGVVFDVREGALYINQSWYSPAPNGISVTGTDALHKIYTADVTGDGNNDVCIQVRSSEKEFGEYIMIYDCFNDKIYHIMGETAKSEYYLGDADGKLLAYKSKLTSDGSRGNVISHENLSADMTDSFLAVDFSGHNERCIYDSDYCSRQRGNCSLKSGGHTPYCTVNSDYCSKQEGECQYSSGHHNEVTSGGHHEEEPEHHGHSEYCLQNTDYCSQQEGECPYTGGHHGEEPEHHGHSEYCLQNADYCSQQEGKCPYRPDDLEDMPTVLHGHSEHCLQDLDYCVQQEGVCPYRHDDSCLQYSGHCEYCLQDPDYCAQQQGECPYRQNGSNNGGNSSGHSGHHSDGHH